MMKRILSIIIVVTMITAIVTGCSESSDETIVIGFLPNEAGNEWAGFREGIAAEVEAATGRSTEVRTTDSYEALIDAVLSGEVQMAFSGSNQYVQARDDSALGGDHIQPLVTNAEDKDPDKAGYDGYIATRKGSELSEIMESIGDDLTPFGEQEKARIEALEGEDFMFVSASSTSGFKVPRSILYNYYGPEGLNYVQDLDDFADPAKIDFLNIKLNAASAHQSTITEIYDENVSVGAFCCDYWGGEGTPEGATIDDFTIIAHRIVPNGPIWANVDALGEDDAEKIKEHLVGLSIDNATEEGKKLFENTEDGKSYLEGPDDGFIEVDDSFYEIIRQL